MSTDRHPLRDALADAERAGVDYEVPVDLVRTRVRHRRRARATARGGVALGVVAALAVVLPSTIGGVDRSALPVGDWPAQFDRCGKPADAPEDGHAGPVGVGLTLRDGTVGADRTLVTRSTLQVEPQAAAVARLSVTSVSLVAEGVVVAVEERTDPPEVLLPRTPWDARWTVATSQDASTTLASCAQYPDGDGGPRVPAGTYDVVVTQTLEWSTFDDEGTVRTSWTLPVTLTDQERATPPAPLGCGTGDDVLAEAAGRDTGGLPLEIDAYVPARVQLLDDVLRIPVTVANSGPGTVRAHVEQPAVLLTQNGRVRAVPSVWQRGSGAAGMSQDPGTVSQLEGVVPLLDCTATGLADAPDPENGPLLQPGTYEVWIVLDLHPYSPGGLDAPARVVSGGWPIILE